MTDSPRFMKRLFDPKKYSNRVALKSRANCFNSMSDMEKLDAKKPIRVKIISTQESQSTTLHEHGRQMSGRSDLSLMNKK